MERASVSQGEIFMLSAIRTHMATNGTNELTICQMLFLNSGLLYLAMMDCQDILWVEDSG
jgi:hypothetical protein